MSEKKNSKMTKTFRQLVLFHIFFYCKVIEIVEITNLIDISTTTITRDLQELKNAGLLNVKFSKKDNGYIHIDDKNRCPCSEPVFSDNEAKNRHLKKLIRLASIMTELRYHTEVPYYEDYAKNQETCSSWYEKRFSSLSKRTMQRDFKELNKIGYKIIYDRYEKYYIVDFPEGVEGIESLLEELGYKKSIK